MSIDTILKKALKVITWATIAIVFMASIPSSTASLSKEDAKFYALRAVDFVTQYFHDSIYGGFYITVYPNGEPADTRKDSGAASSLCLALWDTYDHIPDPTYKELAIEAADQILRNWDDQYGGFFNCLQRDWTNPDTRKIWHCQSWTILALFRTYEETGIVTYKEKALSTMDFVVNHMWYNNLYFPQEVSRDGSYTTDNRVGEWVEAFGILAAWKAFDATGDNLYRDFALSCAGFERDYLYDPSVGSFYHHWSPNGVILADHVFAECSMWALVETYEHTGDVQWLQLAKTLLNYAKMNLYSTLYEYAYTHEGDTMFSRQEGYFTYQLFKCYELTGDQEFLELAEPIINTYAKYFYSDVYNAFVVDNWQPGGAGQILAGFIFLDHQDWTILAFWKLYDHVAPKLYDFVQLTTEPYDDKQPLWSPDGSRLTWCAYDSSGWYRHIWVMNADGSDKTQLTFGYVVDESADWSPDGKQLVFQRWGIRGDCFDLMVMDSNGSNVNQITFSGLTHQEPQWSHNGSKIAFVYGVSNDIHEIHIINPEGSSEMTLIQNAWRATWSPNDSQLVVQRDDGIWLVSAFPPYKAMRIYNATDARAVYCPQFTPDGKHIIFWNGIPTLGMYGDLYMIDADGNNPIQLTNGWKVRHPPDISPDGKWILFTSSIFGNDDIWKMKLGTVATPIVIFSDDFEGYGVGNAPSPPWVCVFPGGVSGDQVVVDSIKHSGSGSLQLIGRYQSSVMRRSFSSGAIFLAYEAWIYIPPGGVGDLYFTVTSTITPDRQEGYAIICFGNPIGKISAGGGDFPIEGIIANLTENTWFKVGVILDRNANSFDVYINDTYMGSFKAAADPSRLNFIDAFMISASGASSGPTVYYDDIIVSEGNGTLSPIQTPPSVPDLISPVNGAYLTGNSVTFNWSTSSEATDYQIEIDGPSGKNMTVYSTSYTTDLIQGLYTWRVRAHNSAGYSDWTTTWNFSLKPLSNYAPKEVTMIDLEYYMDRVSPETNYVGPESRALHFVLHLQLQNRMEGSTINHTQVNITYDSDMPLDPATGELLPNCSLSPSPISFGPNWVYWYAGDLNGSNKFKDWYHLFSEHKGRIVNESLGFSAMRSYDNGVIPSNQDSVIQSVMIEVRPEEKDKILGAGIEYGQELVSVQLVECNYTNETSGFVSGFSTNWIEWRVDPPLQDVYVFYAKFNITRKPGVTGSIKVIPGARADLIFMNGHQLCNASSVSEPFELGSVNVTVQTAINWTVVNDRRRMVFFQWLEESEEVPSVVNKANIVICENRGYHTDGFSVLNETIPFNAHWDLGVTNEHDQGSPPIPNLNITLDGTGIRQYQNWWIWGLRPQPDEWSYGPDTVWDRNSWLWHAAPDDALIEVGIGSVTPVIIYESPGYSSSRSVDDMIFSKPGIQHATVSVTVGDHPDRIILVRILAVEPVGWRHPNWGNVTILTDTSTPTPSMATSDDVEWNLVEEAGTYNFSVDILVEPSPELGAVYFVPGVNVHESVWENPLSGMPIQSTNVTFENVEVTSEGGKVGIVMISSNDMIYWTQARTHFMHTIDYGMGNLLYITAKSPVNIIVTAPNGLRVGYDALTGSILGEIPGAFYSGPNSEPQVIAIPDPVSGNYKVDTYGTGNGSYTIAMESLSYDGLVTSNQSVTGTISSGIRQAYTCSMESDGSLSSIKPNYLTIDNGGHGIPTGEGWYEVGSSASFAVAPTVAPGGDGIRYVFTGWIGSGEGSYTGPDASHSVTINNPITETAQWKTQYYIVVNSQYDSPTPGSSWYDTGSVTTASVTSPIIGSDGTRYVCTGWTGTGSVPVSGTGTSVTFTMNEPSSIIWNWKTQYYLTLNTNPAEVLSINPSAVSGEGWYDSGTTAVINAQQDVDKVAGESRYDFRSWTGTGTNIIFSEDFESYDIGSTPCPPWVSTFSGGVDGDQIVVNSVAHSGTRSLQLIGRYLSSVVRRPFSSSANLLSYEAWIYIREEWGLPQGGTGSIAFLVSSTITPPAQEIYALICYGNPPDWKITAGGGDFPVEGIIGSVNYNTWFKVGAILDRNANSFRAYIDDVYMGTFKAAADPSRLNFIDALYVTSSGGVMSSTVYYDDITVKEVYALPPSVSTVDILMDGPKTVTANYQLQYKIAFDQSGIGDDFKGAVVVIDTTDYPVNALPVEFWWDKDSTHNFEFMSPLTGGASKRYVWVSTSGVSYKQSDTLTITESGTVTASYKTQYLLTVQTNPLGLSPVPGINPSSPDWFYDAGTKVTLTANPIPGYTFSHWSFDRIDLGFGVDRVEATMDAPHAAVANYVPFTMNCYVTDSDFNPIVGFDVIFISSGSSYKLTATNPGTYYYNLEFVNNGPVIDSLTILISIPSDFVLIGAQPVQIDRAPVDHTFSDGTLTVKIGSLGSSQQFTLTAHLDYGLKGTVSSYPSDPRTGYVRAYSFATSVNSVKAKAPTLVATGKKVTAIGGFVTDTNGVPKNGLKVTITDRDGTATDLYTGVMGDGFYFLEVPEGECYKVEVYNSFGTRVGIQTNVQISKDAFVVIDFGNLSPADPAIEGFVKDENGRPVADVTVELLDHKGRIAVTTLTNVGGYYVFRFTQPGQYVVRIAVPQGYTTTIAMINLKVEQFQTATANFVIAKS